MWGAELQIRLIIASPQNPDRAWLQTSLVPRSFCVVALLRVIKDENMFRIWVYPFIATWKLLIEQIPWQSEPGTTW